MWPISNRRGRAGCRGFSFLEVLVAVVITSFLGAALYGTFSQGLRLWKWSLGVSTETDRYIFFEKLQDDLRNAHPYGLEAFEGETASLRFFSLRRRPVPRESGGGRAMLPVRITYRFDAEKGQILRSEQDIKDFLLRGRDGVSWQADEAAQSAGRALIEGIAGLEFTFFKEKTKKKAFFWSQRWDEPCMPEAVRIKLKYDDNLREKYFSRVISVPSERCAQKNR